MAGASHVAELEFQGTDVVEAWHSLEPVVAACADLRGTPAIKSDYNVTNWDHQGTVTAANLRDALDHLGSPKSISVIYTARSGAGSDPHSFELTIMRYRRFKELNVHIRVTGPMDVQTLGLFEQTKRSLASAISRLQEP